MEYILLTKEEANQTAAGKHSKLITQPCERKRALHPCADMMFQKSIWGCETGQNEISVQAIREIRLAGRQKHATSLWGRMLAKRSVIH